MFSFGRSFRLAIVSVTIALASLLAWVAQEGRGWLYPTSGFSQCLPWSAPLLRFWCDYRNEVCRAQALQVLMQAGPPYRQEGWERLLRLNPEPEEWSTRALATAPGDAALMSLALQAVTPDRPASQQLAAEFLRQRRSRCWSEISEQALAQTEPRRRLLLLSLLGDGATIEGGRIWFQDDNPVPPPVRQQVERQFHQDAKSQGLISWEPPPDKQPTPDLSSAPAATVYRWLEQVRDRDRLQWVLRHAAPPYAERAAIELWFDSPSQRRTLRPYLQRALNRPMDGLCQYQLGPLELLGLTEAFPQSRLAQGCRAFGRLRGGTYFGDYFYWSGTDEKIPERGLGLPGEWRDWLATYPDHPGADDASYWLGRTMERQGRRYEALAHFLLGLPHLPGDQDMKDRWKDHVMWLLDVGVTAGDLEQFRRTYPDTPAAPMARYALALRRARAHHYQEALGLTEGLNLKSTQRLLGQPEWWNTDWSLAEPDHSRAATFRPTATLDEDLHFQRELWKRCLKQKGQESPLELYSLARLWSEPGGWRIGYCLLLQGQRGFLWRYSWDAYVNDSRPGFRPDADAILAEARGASHNEVILALMERVLHMLPEQSPLREKARYTRFAALEAQCDSSCEGESASLRRDFYGEACREGRLLLREFPDTTMADDVFLSLSAIKERPDIRKFLEIHFPEGDRI